MTKKKQAKADPPAKEKFSLLKLLNTNTVHNVLNVVIAVVAVWGMFDWTTLGFSQEVALAIVAVSGLTKLTMNAIRDGLRGMVAQQPPVKTT